MSARDVSDLLNEIEAEYLEEGRNDENEKDEEKENEDEKENINSAEKAGAKGGDRLMGFMPGDAKKEEEGQEQAPKKKSKKEDSKEEKKDEKKSKLEEVKKGEPFDHGLGRGSFSGGLGKGKNR